MTNTKILHTSSYKDIDAQVCYVDGTLYREIKPSYFKNYDLLNNSGLYEKLTEQNLLVKHIECKELSTTSLFIKPEKVFISYPWEWSFSQLKDAALLTLDVLKTSLDYGMILKDANCYNVQFYKGKPLFIDTTSFEKYEEGMFWSGYLQFCSNFITPLALMAHTDLNLGKLLLAYPDGLDLTLVTKLLPFKTRFDFGLFLHIHQHALFQSKFENSHKKINYKYSRFQLLSLIDSLYRCVNKLSIKKQKTQWDNYYNITNYTDKSFKQKIDIVTDIKNKLLPKTVLDIGANNGYFSRIFSDCAKQILSTDYDINTVEQNYIKSKQNNETSICPLVIDITNTSPAIGLNNEERFSFLQRASKNDVVLALALVHHLAIGKNIPLYKIAEFFSQFGKFLIIEFVNKDDSQVQKLLINRKDIFVEYSEESFEKAFTSNFKILEKHYLDNSDRLIYLMENKDHEKF